jgi:hypothetical protein
MLLPYLDVVQAYAAGFRASDPDAVLACFATNYSRLDHNGHKFHTVSNRHKQGLKAYMDAASQQIDPSSFQVSSFKLLEESAVGAVARVVYVAKRIPNRQEIQWSSIMIFKAHQRGGLPAEIVMITTLNRYIR